MTLRQFWQAVQSGEKVESTTLEYGDGKFKCHIFNISNAHLWYEFGTLSIPLLGISSYEQLKERCDLYMKDKAVCCRCGKIINRNERQTYKTWFAGIYCNDCWTNEDEKERNWDYSHLD